MPERGPHKFSEGDLDFQFDKSWTVCSQWDKEPAYEALISLSEGVKGVDFLGLRAGPKEKLYLIEVKYYLGSERDPKTQQRLANGGAELLDIVVAKVRDTVMGLITVARTEPDAAWRACVKHLTERGLWVVLWIEHGDARQRPPGRVKQRKSLDAILLDGLKRRCRWFTTNVAIRFLGGTEIPGLEVRSRAGARGTRGRRP